MTQLTRRAAALLTAGLLLTLPMSATAGTLPTSATTPEPDDDAQLLLLLDASGSMADPDATGEPKIEAARAALHEVVDDLGTDQQVGLRVFGGSVSPDQPTQAKCTDSQLVVPIGTGNAQALGAAVEDYAPLGETPIAHALQQAADDLSPDGNRTIVLVSDGIATCDPDPCEIAEQLSADGLDLVVHTVGLGADDQTRTQLQCIADAGGGTYYDAADTDTLTTALTRISTRAFRPFTITGTPVEGTVQIADAPVLTPGQYTDTLALSKGQAKHYLLRREIPGSILHAGATMRPDRGGLSAYDVRLTTRAGDVCGMSFGMPWSGGAGNSFGTTGTSSARFGGYDADEDCSTASELVLSVYPQNGGAEAIAGTPYELVVIEEPPVTDIADLPPRADLPEWQGLAPGDPVDEVVAGSSLNDAPLLEAGQTYSSELTRGEIVFFRVPVQHGQRLEALLEIAEPTGLLAETTGPVSDIVDIELIGPNRARARSVLADTGDLKARAIMQADNAVRAAATTPEVRWANHASGNDEGAVLAGDYVAAVSLTSNDELLLPVPFTLTTQVVGEVNGAPEYAEAGAPSSADEGTATGQVGATASAPAEDLPGASSTVTGSDDGAGADAAPVGTVEDDPGMPLAWLLGGAGVVVAGAGAALLATRNRSTSR